MPPGLYYVVRNWRDDTFVYIGRFLCNAARSLDPGTCYGKGSALPIAELACREQCAAARKSVSKKGYESCKR